MYPYDYQLARVIHEERIQEALKRQRNKQGLVTRLRLSTHLLARLGDWLIDLGKRLKVPATAMQSVE